MSDRTVCFDPIVGKPADVASFLQRSSVWNGRGPHQLYRVLGELATCPSDKTVAVIVMYPSTKREHAMIKTCLEVVHVTPGAGD